MFYRAPRVLFLTENPPLGYAKWGVLFSGITAYLAAANFLATTSQLITLQNAEM